MPLTITEILDARPFKFSTDNKKRVQINVVLIERCGGNYRTLHSYRDA
jgi:hypothetical protein